jgi:YidC/Oxa1 family membrane protein insertase
MLSIFGVPVDAAYHVVSGFTSILTPVLGGVAAVAAIIAVTVAVRIILMPLSFRALRGQAAAARLAPQLQALRQRFARQPERLQREMAALYKREGTSMFASITPFLLQWPLLSVMYLLFRSAQVGGKPNTLLSHDLLGVPLGSHWLGGVGPVSGQGLVFLGVFALLAGLIWLSVRLGQLMTAPATAVPAPARALALARTSVPARRSASARRSVSARAQARGTARAQTRGAAKAEAGGAPALTAKPTPVPGGALVKAVPYLTVVIAAFAPLAAGIYLLVSTGWSLVERRFWRSGRVPGWMGGTSG